MPTRFYTVRPCELHTDASADVRTYRGKAGDDTSRASSHRLVRRGDFSEQSVRGNRLAEHGVALQAKPVRNFLTAGDDYEAYMIQCGFIPDAST